MDWARVQDIFDRAIALPQADRDAFLAAECPDPDLAQTLRDLLAEAASGSPNLLRSLVEAGAAEVASSASIDPASQTYGPYAIRRELGRGGMGEVYLAHRTDKEFEHQIALKIVRRGLASGEMLSRFRQERQILARLDHPNIVRLLDGGTTPDGIPYLAMDFVEGIPITEFCDARQLDVNARCKLMLPVCDAVAHAHRNLIVHRDLKPANILVTPQGIPKLLDFGIAKLIDDAADPAVTQLRPLTPDYASPEQLSGAPITTATDVYQLGAILLRLLSGRKPGEAPHPSLPSDLDLIVRRAMHPDPALRYPSASVLADDLQRFLDRRPILARPDSFFYSARRWVQRSPLTAVALVIALVSASAGAGAAYYQGRRAERRFQQVRSLATSFVFQFDDKLKDLSGSLPARTFAVETALHHLDSLSLEASGDPGLQSELAAAYLSVARIQGDPSSANIGQSDQAFASLEKSLQLSRHLLQLDPKNISATRTLAGALSTKGILLAFVRRQRPAGIDALREAVLTANRLSHSPSLEDLRIILIANVRLAELLTPANPKEGMPFYNTALAAASDAFAISHDDKDRVSAGAALIGVARIHRDLGNPGEVIRRMNDAAALYAPILAADPNSRNTRRQLSIIYQELARALGNPYFFNVGQPRQALEALQRADSLREAQRSADSTNIDIPAGTALLLSNRAAIQLSLDPALALQTANSALAISGTLLAKDPKSIYFLRTRENLLNILASIHIRARRPALALPILSEIHTSSYATLKRDPNDLSSLDLLGRTLPLSGIALTSLARYDDALKAHSTAESSTAATLARFPDDLFFLRNHACALEAFGDFYSIRGEKAKAASYYRRAIDSWTRWSSIASPGPYPNLFLNALNQKLANPSDLSLILQGIER